MFERLRLYKELKEKTNKVFYILPGGLYDENNTKILYSELIISNLLNKYEVGDTISIYLNRYKDLKDIINKSAEVKKYNFDKKFESVDVFDLTIEYMSDMISKFNFSKMKNPYENFLEAVIINLMIESLNNSKCLIGGLWSTGSILSTPKKGKSSYEFFVRNVSEKNSYIKEFRKYLEKYPEDLRLRVNELKTPYFKSNRSDYSVFLEYRILQIKYKIVLQEICMHSAYMSDKDKKRFDKEIKLLKERLKGYPVSLLTNN